MIDSPDKNDQPLLPHDEPESSRNLIGQLVKFLGLMTTIGGSLALIRTLGVQQAIWFSGPRVFFLALIPFGLILWGVGFWLSISPSQSNDKQDR